MIENNNIENNETEKTEDEKTRKLLWYVASTQSGHENKVHEYINKRISTLADQDIIKQVLVAEIEEDVKKDGLPTGKKKKINLFPGYIFIQMIMTEEAWFMIRNTPGVTGFIGSSGKGAQPFPVPSTDMEPVLKRLGLIDEDMYERYKTGDLVKVIHGSLENTEGKIFSINKDTGKVIIETTFFGRPTQIEVDFADIEKQ